MTFVVQWKGIDQVRANLRALAERYPVEMGRVLREEGMAIMDESIRICPVDKENMHEDGTPHLVDTGQVQGPYNDGQGPYIILSYDTPYAVVQHEVQEYHHDFPEQWKYLEHPLNARAGVLPSNLAKGVDLERMMVGYVADTQQSANERIATQNASLLLGRLQSNANTKYGQLMGRYRL